MKSDNGYLVSHTYTAYVCMYIYIYMCVSSCLLVSVCCCCLLACLFVWSVGWLWLILVGWLALFGWVIGFTDSGFGFWAFGGLWPQGVSRRSSLGLPIGPIVVPFWGFLCRILSGTPK